jgi:CheY-like chemotaxis protein
MTATVLVVEDERKLRDLIRSYLERAGFTVLSAGSGAEAITMAAAGPDLVVLDLGLPDVPGETVAWELRATAATPDRKLPPPGGQQPAALGSVAARGAGDLVRLRWVA